MKLKTIILILTMSLTCNLKAQTEYSTCIDSNTNCYITILENNYIIQLLTSDTDDDDECDVLIGFEYSFGTIEYNADGSIFTDYFRQNRIVLKQSKDTLFIKSGPTFLKDKTFVKCDFYPKEIPEELKASTHFDIKTELASYYSITNDEIKNGKYTLDWEDELTINNGEFKLSYFEIPISLGRYEQKGSVVTFYNESNYPEFYALIGSDSITFKIVPGFRNIDVTIKK